MAEFILLLSAGIDIQQPYEFYKECHILLFCRSKVRFDSRGKRVRIPVVSETEQRPIPSAEPPTLDRLRRQLLPFCQKHPIARLEVFGSVADGTATPASDVDLMMTFDPGVRVGKEFFAMALELEDILGRRVDLVERAAIERMDNPFKRGSILSCTQLVYAK